MSGWDKAAVIPGKHADASSAAKQEGAYTFHPKFEMSCTSVKVLQGKYSHSLRVLPTDLHPLEEYRLDYAQRKKNIWPSFIAF